MIFHSAASPTVRKWVRNAPEKYSEIDFRNLKPAAQGRRNPSVRTT
jgi:hypothetical protein